MVRGAETIGAVNGVVSGGPVAFEVNHPGALCWGAGIPAGDPLKAITPDIQTGDKVSFSFCLFVCILLFVCFSFLSLRLPHRQLTGCLVDKLPQLAVSELQS